MNLPRTSVRHREETAFTMIEIAISLAIIAFALVAIIGVLPIGLNVQRDNREETIINHDVNIFMDTIRNGARGADDLTNYVVSVTNYWSDYDVTATTTNLIKSAVDWYTVNGAQRDTTPLPVFRLNTGGRIIGLLSTPERIPDNNYTVPFRSNHVVAYVRALSGPASEKFPQNDANVQDLAFTYRLIPQVARTPAYDMNSPYGTNLYANLSDVRLLFRWPILPNGDVGPSRQSYRTQIGGRVEIITDVDNQRLYFFQPNSFTAAFTNSP